MYWLKNTVACFQVCASAQNRLEVTEEEVRSMNESLQSKKDNRDRKREDLVELNAKNEAKKIEKEDYQRRIKEIREIHYKAAEDAKALAMAEVRRFSSLQSFNVL